MAITAFGLRFTLAMAITYVERAESAATGKKLAAGLGIAKGKPQGAFPPLQGSFSTASCNAYTRINHTCPSHGQKQLWQLLQVLAHIHLNQALWCRGGGKGIQTYRSSQEKASPIPITLNVSHHSGQTSTYNIGRKNDLG